MLISRGQKTLAAALLLALTSSVAIAGTFNYHGQLTESGRGANGRYDIQISVYPSESAAIPSAPATTLYGVEVRNGTFNADLDLGSSVQKGSYVGVAVRPAGGSQFVALSGRTPVAPDGVCPDSWLVNGNTGLTGSEYIGNNDAVNFHVAVGSAYSANFYTSNGVSLAPYSGETPAGTLATSLSFSNGAAGAYSIAGGFNAATVNTGSIVFADQGGFSIADSGPDQFIISATGGTMVNGNTLFFPDFDDMVIYPRTSGGDDDTDLLLVSRNGNYGRLYEQDSTGILQIDATAGVHINSPVEINGTVKTGNMHVNGGISQSTAANPKAASDARIKQNIESVNGALGTLSQLHFVTFEYTDAYRAEHPEIAPQRYYNVVAQEFGRVFPDAVSGSGEYLPGAQKTAANEVLQVDTYPAQIVTMAAVQELAQKNAALQRTVDRLTARLEKLEAAQGK
jgi:endosialidase-like protein